MRALVTGAGGFIGSHLVDSLLAQGSEVRAADLRADQLAHTLRHPRLEVLLGDITDSAHVAALVEGVEVVYHLASAHLDVSQPDAHYYRVNVGATEALLAAACESGVRRLVHVSSNGVLGDIQRLPADESTPCQPTNIYERTKLLGEEQALAFQRRTGFPVVVARPAWVYGPRCPRTARLLRSVQRGRFLMFGDGGTLRHPIYVADAVQGLQLCAERGEPGAVYFLAGERPVSLETLVQTMAGVLGIRVRIMHLPVALGIAAGYLVQTAFKPLGRRPPISRRTIDFFLKDNAYDTGKAQRELGFRPFTCLVTGMQQTASTMSDGLPQAAVSS
jgi:nucleoside-diphosphate-sugar epimerase